MNKADLAFFSIDKAIVHDVPIKKDEKIVPVYSESLTSLNQELKLFFQDRIKDALNSSKSYPVIFDSDQKLSPFPHETHKLLQDQNILVESSATIAKHLYEIQTNINSPGILMVLLGKIRVKEVLVILKLERDEGARLIKDDQSRSINIQQVRDLMLTKKTQVYKVGLFFDRDPLRESESIDFDGYVNDAQARDYNKIVAAFFLTKFLGCKMRADSRITTKGFLDASMKFIQGLDDQIKKADYYQHLVSYTGNNLTYINPRSFANDFLEVDDRKSYLEFLTNNKVPVDRFNKDIDLVRSKIKKKSFDFDNGFTLLVYDEDEESIRKKVKMTPAEKDKLKVEFEARLKSVGS